LPWVPPWSRAELRCRRDTSAIGALSVLILLLVGALTVSGGILIYTDGKIEGYLAVTAICAVVGIVARSGMLVAMAVIGLSACPRRRHQLLPRQLRAGDPPTGADGGGVHRARPRDVSPGAQAAPGDRTPRVIASRTSLILVNFGFWVGSLWGDSLWLRPPSWSLRSGDLIPDWVFAVLWAVALIGTGIWAVRQNRRWVVNTVAVFGAFHFYTQYFERLGASPATLVVGGVIALGFAVGLARYNRTIAALPRGCRFVTATGSITTPAILEEMVARLGGLRHDTQRKWGTLTAGEMVCHIADCSTSILGRSDSNRPAKHRPILEVAGTLYPHPLDSGKEDARLGRSPTGGHPTRGIRIGSKASD
jgi:hypothetical protein